MGNIIFIDFVVRCIWVVINMRLKQLRESKNISQRQAALGLNLSPSLYNRYENGTREPPNAMLPVLADFFGVTVDELLGRDMTKDRDEDLPPRTLEARIVSFGMDQLPQEEREKILNILQVMYAKNPDLFKKGDDDDAGL